MPTLRHRSTETSSRPATRRPLVCLKPTRVVHESAPEASVGVGRAPIDLSDVDDHLFTQEFPAGSRDFKRVLATFIRKKRYLAPGVVQRYYQLLRHHVNDRTITVHMHYDGELHELMIWFTVYDLPRMADDCIPPEHANFLQALAQEGLAFRHLYNDVGLEVFGFPYEPHV